MINVKDAMKNVIKFHADDKISDVAQKLRDNKISWAPIVDDDSRW